MTSTEIPAHGGSRSNRPGPAATGAPSGLSSASSSVPALGSGAASRTADGRRPRRELVVFLAVTFGLTALSTAVALGQSVDVRHIGDASGLGQTAMYAQALWPLLGAAAARLAVRRPRRPGAAATRAAAAPGCTGDAATRDGWGWRRPSARVLGLAWLYGVSYPLLAGLVLWMTGLGGFDGAGLADTFALGGLPTAVGAALAVTLGLTVGCLPYVLLAIGEEVGWRGVLVPHLAEGNSPARVVLLGGLIWSAFHLPIIVALGGTPDGVPTPVAAVCFTVALTALGATLAWQRLRHGLWPAVVTHAAVNATLYTVVEPATTDRAHTGWFGTETGLLLAVASVVAAVCWSRRAPLRPSADGTVVANIAKITDIPDVPDVAATPSAASTQATPTQAAPAQDGGPARASEPIDTSDMLVVHAMFRRQFGLLPDLVRASRPGDIGQATAVADHLDLLLALLREHHSGEDRVLWPLLVERAPTLTAAATLVLVGRQHDDVDQLADAVRQAAQAWRRGAALADRDRLAGLLEDLGVALEDHLDAEEREIVPLAATLLTATEWAALGRDGELKLSPRQLLLSLGMIEDGAGPQGLARMTSELPAVARPLVAGLARRVHRRTMRTLATT
ncbi:hemerythrin domain-containing protein [Parafrankia sp. EUN1f]|uniref:hemerythrin domain-containing protein n=1 Tax=Parafrankia sp. EUN1f TaxID=102897 RepID=UPI0001C470E1|nr:hemerythrin domain-containing protein [Parafrankia sp. EUN1f]EFC80026.1 Abortive infection protein [Parafrankia sp. EUN1f]